MDWNEDVPLAWDEVAHRLHESRSYWLATVGFAGEPHVTPLWGAVVTNDLYMFTDRTTVKARDLSSNNRVVVHLEDAEDALIVQGVLYDVSGAAQLPAVREAFAAKYHSPTDSQYLAGDDPGYIYYVLRPTHAMVWNLAEYDTSKRRWKAS